MSTTTETPELETAIADAELTDEEAERVRELVQQGGQSSPAIAFVLGERDGSEPEPKQAAPAELPSGEPSKKQLEQLDAELRRHERRVHEVMGAFVHGFETCEACGGVGLVAPGAPPPRPQTHEWFVACSTCAGFGEVLTGSLRDGQTSRDCPECKGRGYLEALDSTGHPLASQDSAVAVGAVTPPPAEPPPPPPANGEAVTFGTPAWMGNPAIGR